MRLVGHMIGTSVLIRSRESGVWAGTLDDADGTAVRLSAARRIWSWEGAGECLELARTGPTGGKITAEGDVVVLGVCEVHPMQPAAVAALEGVAVWTG